jgi:hypothetical protein
VVELRGARLHAPGVRRELQAVTSYGAPPPFISFMAAPSAVIDTLMIRLTNAAAPCCNNPMGLDNVVLK